MFSFVSRNTTEGISLTYFIPLDTGHHNNMYALEQTFDSIALFNYIFTLLTPPIRKMSRTCALFVPLVMRPWLQDSLLKLNLVVSYTCSKYHQFNSTQGHKTSS